jgi:hypothetical protein
VNGSPKPAAGQLDPRRAALRLRYRCQMLATGGESLLGVGEEQTYEDLLAMLMQMCPQYF